MTGTRRLLTFRLDRDFRQRLATRLAGEGRTMSEVVILGLQLYVQRSGWFSGPPGSSGTGSSEAGSSGAGASGAGASGATTAVASVGDLALPDQVAAFLRGLRKSGESDLLSATLARLHEVGWPLRPLAVALGISRQAVQARIRACPGIPEEIRASVPEMPPPSAFPRRRPAAASGRRPHLTVKVDQALRAAAHRRAEGEGSSLSQVIEKILDSYLRHGMPPGAVSNEVLLGDTTPTRPASRRRRRARGSAPS